MKYYTTRLFKMACAIRGPPANDFENIKFQNYDLEETMIKRNNGFTEQEKLQNRFTAFITTSISRARIDYLRKEKSRAQHTYEMDDEKFASIADSNDFVSELCDTDSLAHALQQLDERERYVLIARVLEEKSFEEIADKLGLKYKGVAAIYYRTTAKLRNILGGN